MWVSDKTTVITVITSPGRAAKRRDYELHETQQGTTDTTEFISVTSLSVTSPAICVDGCGILRELQALRCGMK